MTKWLDKYKDGGFVGLTTEGRNFSPAWGGQFKRGGWLSRYEQDEEYNCGPFASSYLLAKKGIDVDPKMLEKLENTTSKEGTDPDDIRDTIGGHESFNTSIQELANSAPAMVAYQHNGDGHYSVVDRVDEDGVHIFNVAKGKTDVVPIDRFQKKWHDKDADGKEYNQWMLTAQRGVTLPASESTNTTALRSAALNNLLSRRKTNIKPSSQPSLNPDYRTDEEKQIAAQWYEDVNNPSVRTLLSELIQYPARVMDNPIKLLTGEGYEKEVKESRKTQLSPYLSDEQKTNATLNEARDLGINALINAGTAELGFIGNGMMSRGIIPLFKQGSTANFTADLLQLSKTDWNKVKEGELDEIANILINGASTITHMGNFDAQQVVTRLKNWSSISKADKIDVLKDITNLGFAGGQQFQRKDVSSSDTTSFFKHKDGGVVKDNLGYWNPDNEGKIVEIDSPEITMRGVGQPLMGVSDEGDVKLMKPGKDYKFKGKKVREYPIAKYGINELHQLQDFTNKPSSKNWLTKYL